MKSPANALSTVQSAMDQSKTLSQVSPSTQPNIKPKLPPKPTLKAPPPKMTTKVNICLLWNPNYSENHRILKQRKSIILHKKWQSFNNLKSCVILNNKQFLFSFKKK